ncbi:MAG: PorV/PorQ family protein [Elusimicrobiota bacterium]
MKNTFLLSVVFIFHLEAIAFSGTNPNKGTSTAVFLKMIPGARPAAMGNAFTGISDDINAIYTNASGIALIKHPEVSATHIKWLEDINNTFVSAVYPSGKNALGIGVNYLSMGEIEMRDDSGTLLSEKNSVYNANVSLVLSRKLSDSFMAGLTVKNIMQKLGTYNGKSVDGNGYAFDFSALTKIGPVSCGFSIQNLGSSIKILDVDNNIPFLTRVGAGFKPLDKLLIAFDAEFPRDDDMKIHIGGEYALQELLTIRAGYNQIDGGLNRLTSTQGWTLGLGSKTYLGQRSIYGSEETDTENLKELVFDYALAKFSEDLGFTHRFTISIKFK